MENLRFNTYFHAIERLIRDLVDDPDPRHILIEVNALIASIEYDMETSTEPLSGVNLGVLRSMLADTTESIERIVELDGVAEVLNHRLLKIGQ